MLWLLIAFHTIMIASVTATLEQNPITEGDVATLIIEAEGNDITFPKLEAFSGYKIANRSTTRSMVSINGNVKKTLIRKFTFSPQKEIVIPALEVMVDGKKEMTEPIALKIKQDVQNGQKAFIFEQKVDKTDVYVGEPILLTYTFKQRVDRDLSEANFNAPSFANFWAKTTKKVPNKIEGDYNVYKINYLLYPQKSGTLEIESARMDAGILSSQKRDFFNFQQVKWKTFYSNKLHIKVKELPAGADFYGDYTFTAVADKNVTNANEPVNLTVTITGEGNVDDLDDFKVEVPNATVYADKSQKSAHLSDGKNAVLFKQKFAIVSDRNFTIPSLSLSFFDGKEVQKRHSRAFKIKVKNTKVQKTVGKLEKKTAEKVTEKVEKVTVEKTPMMPLVLTALLAFLAGVIVTLFAKNIALFKKEAGEKPIQTRIKNAKEDKELLSLLLPYVDKTPKLKAIIRELEENIYAGKKHLIDRKKLAKEFDSLLDEKKEESILDV